MDKRHKQRQAHVQWPGLTYNRALSKAIQNVSISILHRKASRRGTYGAGGPYRSLSTSACSRIVRIMRLNRIERCPQKSLVQYFQVARFDLRCHDCAVVAGVEIVMRKIEVARDLVNVWAKVR